VSKKVDLYRPRLAKLSSRASNVNIVAQYSLLLLLTDRISTAGNVIASVHPSVRLFSLELLNRVTFDPDLLHAYGSRP